MRRLLGISLFIAFAAWATDGPTFTNVKVEDAFVFPGTLIKPAQIIEIKVTSGSFTLTSVNIKNIASDNKITGGQVEYIEIRRGSTTGTLLVKVTSLAGLESTTGVTIDITTNNTFNVGTHRLYFLVKLKADEGLAGRKLQLSVTLNGTTPNYTVPAATFTVVGPELEFEELEGANPTVYRGQTFLAARINVDAGEVPLDFSLSQLKVWNAASSTALAGKYVTRIEVRRALDGALLGAQTTATELEKFATTGTPVSLTANNSFSAYTQTRLEIWITLTDNTPLGHKVKVDATLRCEGTDFSVGEEAKVTEFTTTGGTGLTAEAVTLSNQGVVPGQTFLTQRIRLVDDDDDPYNVNLGSILVRNAPDSDPLAEQHITKIEVKRKADGAVLGSATSLSGLNTTGVRIVLTANNVILDDTETQVDLYVTLADSAPIGRKIKLASVVSYSEGGASLSTDIIEGPAVFTVKAPEGLETIENKTTPPSDRNVYPNQLFLAQKIYLEDKDDNPYEVRINRILVKNLSTGTTLVSDKHVAKIEVRDSTGKILGETTSISGLTTTGVWVNTTANNTIADDKNLTVEIWITLKGDVPAGLKFKAGTRIEHTEGGQTFTKPKPDTFLDSTVEFTTATDAARTVNFTYTPDKPKWNEEITFTPSVSPSTGIVYARWDFGDGTVVERKTAEDEKPLDPIKHKYGKGGEFTVTYAVRDEANRESRVSKKITVTNEPPKNVDFSFSPSSPTVDQTVTFTPSDQISDPDGDIKKATFRWDFGDGSNPVTTTGARPVTHTYTQAGTFTVTLTVTDEGGASAAAKKDVRVEQPTPPPPTVTSITVDPPNPEAGKPVKLTAATTAPENDPATAWEWDFGDGSTQTTDKNSVTHTYANPGQYTVQVWARNNAGWSTPFSRQITVYPPGVTFGALVLDKQPVTGNQCRIQIFAPAGATDLKITILDQAGRPVLLDKSVAVGLFTWDLKDREGRVVPNGLYFFYVTAKIEGTIRRTELGRILVRR